MKTPESKIIARRIVNSYLSSVISISLVLLLIGMAALIVSNAKSVSDYLKEHLNLVVLLKQDVGEDKASAYAEKISAFPYVKETRIVSKEEGIAELKEMLGEDFLNVFASTPVPVSVEVALNAEYVSKDSLDFVVKALAASEIVDEVDNQETLIGALDSNLAKISALFGVFILLLLFVSFVLINNTVRLNAFSKRFTIHTMKLVGATRAFIRAPFIKAAALQGLLASIVAVGALLIIIFRARRGFPELFEIFNRWTTLMTLAIVVVCGVLICVICTVLVINKLVRMTKDELYY